jgi:hypothetical protein
MAGKCAFSLPLFLSFSTTDSSSSDNQTVASRASRIVFFLGTGRTARTRIVTVATTRAPAVQLDSVPLAGDAITLTSAAHRRGTGCAVVTERAG